MVPVSGVNIVPRVGDSVLFFGVENDFSIEAYFCVRFPLLVILVSAHYPFSVFFYLFFFFSNFFYKTFVFSSFSFLHYSTAISLKNELPESELIHSTNLGVMQ